MLLYVYLIGWECDFDIENLSASRSLAKSIESLSDALFNIHMLKYQNKSPVFPSVSIAKRPPKPFPTPDSPFTHYL